MSIHFPSLADLHPTGLRLLCNVDGTPDAFSGAKKDGYGQSWGSLAMLKTGRFPMRNGNYEPVRITGVITDQITDPPPGGTRYEIPLRLSRVPEPEWVKYLLRAWDAQNHPATHRTGIEVGSDR